jgi:hypothetical protein
MELELSLVYDFMYTKAVVIHNWCGYCIRLIAPAATATAFFLFQICGNKHDYSRVDIVITYMLLVGAFLLDIASLFRATGSTWTCDFLLRRGWRRLLQFVMSLRRLVRAGRYRLWSGSIGQYDLLLSCTHDKTRVWDRMASKMGLEDWWDNKLHSKTVSIGKDVKELVFERVWQRLRSSCSVGDVEEAYSMQNDAVYRSWRYGNNNFCLVSKIPNYCRLIFLIKDSKRSLSLSIVKRSTPMISLLSYYVTSFAFRSCLGLKIGPHNSKNC